jgi:hypothetical protein
MTHKLTEREIYEALREVLCLGIRRECQHQGRKMHGARCLKRKAEIELCAMETSILFT